MRIMFLDHEDEEKCDPIHREQRLSQSQYTICKMQPWGKNTQNICLRAYN